MPIIGFSISRIEAEKKKNPQGKLNISNTPKIVKVEPTPVEGLGNAVKECLKIEWEFDISYEPKIGEVKFYGEIMYLDAKHSETLKMWKKDKKLPDYVMLDALNHLFKAVITKALMIEQDLGLPPSIPFPSAQVTQPEDKKSPKYIE